MILSLRLCSVLKRWDHSDHAVLASECLTKLIKLCLLHLRHIDTQPSRMSAVLSTPWQTVFEHRLHLDSGWLWGAYFWDTVFIKGPHLLIWVNNSWWRDEMVWGQGTDAQDFCLFFELSHQTYSTWPQQITVSVNVRLSSSMTQNKGVIVMIYLETMETF